MISSYSAARSPTRSSRNVAKPRVDDRPRLLRDPAVGGVADQDVTEAERVLSADPFRLGLHELLSHQLLQARADLGPLRIRRQAHDRLPAEDAADHGRPLDDGALPRGEPVEPRRQQRLDRGRDHRSAELDVRLPATVPLREQPVVDQHPQHLLDEERVPLGRGDDPRPEIGRDVLAEQVGDEQLALLSRRAARGRSSSRSSSEVAHVGTVSASSGRAGHRMRIGAPRLNAARYSIRFRNAGSAQWMSSNTTTTGRSLRERLEQPPDRPGDLLGAPEHVVEPDRTRQSRRDEPCPRPCPPSARPASRAPPRASRRRRSRRDS